MSEKEIKELSSEDQDEVSGGEHFDLVLGKYGGPPVMEQILKVKKPDPFVHQAYGGNGKIPKEPKTTEE